MSSAAARFRGLTNAMVLTRWNMISWPKRGGGARSRVLPAPRACWLIKLPAISNAMTMTPTRLRECISLPGWSLRELARRLDIDDGSTRQMARGKRPIGDNLAVWLELVHGAWAALPPDLREGAALMGCDQGKYVRHPVNFRPLTPAEAVELEALASFHRRHPRPEGWEQEALARNRQ